MVYCFHDKNGIGVWRHITIGWFFKPFYRVYFYKVYCVRDSVYNIHRINKWHMK